MNLSLVTGSARPDGIFSQLLDDDGHEVMMTLEHAYLKEGVGYRPKVPRPGEYDCVRGKHHIHGKGGVPVEFETFEITGIEGHSSILFHWGNLNENSKGCVLTGDAIADYQAGAPHTEMVTNSRAAFARFMRLQEGVDSFKLKVF